MRNYNGATRQSLGFLLAIPTSSLWTWRRGGSLSRSSSFAQDGSGGRCSKLGNVLACTRLLLILQSNAPKGLLVSSSVHSVDAVLAVANDRG